MNDPYFMRYDPNRGVAWRPPNTIGRPRAFGRVGQEMLRSSIGPVLDLSGGGARILSRRRRTGYFILRLRDAQRSVTVKARIVWSKHVGFLRYEVGVQFLFVTPRQADDLTYLCRDNRLRRSWLQN